MSLVVIKQPLGHKLDTNQQTGQIIDNGTGEALVYTGTAHGLSDGDYVLIESNFDAYNGYKYVDSIAYDSFQIKDSENSDPIEFVQNADIVFYISILNHGWQCVHLPIVYEIESDIYPSNTVGEDYVPDTVVSQSNDNGYTRLALSGALTDPTAYAKIELVGTGDLAGVYQIITAHEPWNITIDLAYDAGNSFSGYVIVKYYDNYAINVNVYAGLPDTHRWEDRKPFEVAATLKFIPDVNNKVKFSISEVLRAYITTRNNLTLDTLPNNLDFAVAFYIEYFETYDESDGEDITTYTGLMNLDPLIGYAVNAKLPFKSESISFLSDYLEEGDNYARWLTLFERPVVFVGYFFDLSFLNQHNNRDIIIKKGGIDYLTIENPGAGVIRVPIEPESGESEICVEAWVGPGVEIQPASEFDLSTFLNDDTSANNWVLGDNPSFNGKVGALYTPFVVLSGQAFLLHYNFVITTDDGPGTLRFGLGDTNDGDSALSDYIDIPFESVGVYSGDVTINTTNNREFFFVVTTFVFNSPAGLVSSLGYGEEEEVEVPGFKVTESICLEVKELCEDTLIDDDARITEEDRLRLLE